MDIDEEENEMDVKDGKHDPQTDENVISHQMPHLVHPSLSTTKTPKRCAPKKGWHLDADSQAVGIPS